MPVAVRSRRGLAALVLLAATASAQAPQFPVGSEALTVDVVVLDKDGRPVRGLEASDFTVREDGKPRAIVGFEARDLAHPPEGAAEASAVGLPRAADEEPDGRTLGFVVDDLGLDERGLAAIDALKKWVRDRADARDEVTLATSSGAVEWEGRIGTGRGELLDLLGAIRLHRRGVLAARADAVTDWRAYRMLSNRASGADSMPSGEMLHNARRAYEEWLVRARAIVGAIATFSRAHAADRGRKPVFVLAQNFIADADARLHDEAIDVAQRGNVAVYFVDPRGLIAGDTTPGGTSAFGDSMQEVAHHLDLGGGEEMATKSGGAVVRDTNDLEGRLAGAVDESSAYYLLGVQPAAPADGLWHAIDVDVAVKGATVRARRGYYASAQTLAERRVAAAQAQRQDESQAEPPASAPSPVPAAGSPPPAAAAARDVPVFASQADAVTVDVVVLDHDGHPVRDLAAGEFALFEDGQPVPIVGFETRTLAPPAEPPPADTEPTAAATNEGGVTSDGRTHAFLVDDLGIEPTRMPAVTKALSNWIATGADPRDQVTVATTSGEAWWSAAAGAGRSDFEAVLGRVRGLRRAEGLNETLSEYEAYRIDLQGPGAGSASGGAAPGPPTGGSCATGGGQADVRDRVVDRWFRSGGCLCEPMNVAASIASCRAQVNQRASALYRATRARAQAVLGAVERLSRGLAGARGRKSVVVLSEGLLRDAQQSAFESAVDASRHGNTAVSFVDVRGLVGLPFFGADQTAAPAAADIGSLTAEATRLSTAGGEYLAQTTGGSMVADSNDLGAGLARVADESSAYYLLGYQPDRPPDGKWRRLEVKVARRDVKVRARRGYFATGPQPPFTADAANAKDKDKKKNKKDKEKKDGGLPERRLDPALAVGGARDGLPLRVAPHVMETDAAGTRVVVAVEVGTEALTFTGAGAERTAELDVTVVGASRDGKSDPPLDSRVSIALDAKAVGRWFMFSRELHLPPGPAQVRTLVRDPRTGRSGLVAARIEVPKPATAYLSTPILSDRIAPAASGRAAQLVPVAHRSFPAAGMLYCAYEVYVAPGRELRTMPKVTGSYTIQDADGRVVAQAPPTPIAIALGAQIVRVIGFPLDRLEPGRYRLTVRAAEPAYGVDLEAHEAFTVEPAQSAAR